MNDAVACLVVALVMIAFATVILVTQIQASRRIRSAYRQVARNYQGTMAGSSPFEFPNIRFQYHNTFVWLTVQGTSGRHRTYYTLLQMIWPDKGFRLEVYPEGLMQRVGKLMGMEDVEIGSSVFDHEYVITGSDVRSLRDFLTPPVQDRIDRLRKVSDLDGIYISASGGRLLIKKPGYIRDYALLTRFVSLSLDLFDQAMQASNEGIDFVPAADSAPPVEDPVCQICGEEIKVAAVLCRACKTPHHRDCWEYYGACSTFGCGQQWYVPR